MKHEDQCIFCSIANDIAPSIKVYEDELTVTFMDIHPASEGHVLVIPRKHWVNVLDIDEPSLTAVALRTRLIARAIQAALKPDGIRILQTNGAAARQTVFHYHVHLIPAWQGQPLASHGRSPGDPAKIRVVAEKIRQALDAL